MRDVIPVPERGRTQFIIASVSEFVRNQLPKQIVRESIDVSAWCRTCAPCPRLYF